MKKEERIELLDEIKEMKNFGEVLYVEDKKGRKYFWNGKDLYRAYKLKGKYLK